jgi:hypothetical protein
VGPFTYATAPDGESCRVRAPQSLVGMSCGDGGVSPTRVPVAQEVVDRLEHHGQL